MNKTSHVHISETVTRRVAAAKARKGGRPRKNNTHKHHADKNHAHKNGTPQPKSATVCQEPAADDERTIRAKGLLAATLRVWELKHRIHE